MDTTTVFNPIELLIDTFVEELKRGYKRTYGGLKENYCEIIAWAAGMALEIISGSDALYHNVEHTILVTLVGQEILRGKHIREGGVSCDDWLHCILSLLLHDIGYVKNILKDDNVEENQFATGVDGKTVEVVGGTDAALTPYHVDRGQQFCQERFGGHKIINAETLKRNIQHTKFPVPSGTTNDLKSFPALVRAADLIGQLSDPRYLCKTANLFYEFKETGAAERMGYKNPSDLRTSYHKFYWGMVYPYIKPALNYLSVTTYGKVHLSSLYSNVFRVEHEEKNKTTEEMQTLEKA